MPTVPAWTVSASALPGCPCVLRAEAGRAAWAALRAGWRLRAPQRGRRAHPDSLRSSAEPALPGRNFSSQPRVSLLALGVRPGGGMRLGGGPSRPAPQAAHQPAGTGQPDLPRRLGHRWRPCGLGSNELRGDTTLRPRKHTRPHTAALRAPGSGSHPHHAPRASAELGRLSYLSWGSLLLKTDK